jgi:hypothetical protein
MRYHPSTGSAVASHLPQKKSVLQPAKCLVKAREKVQAGAK